MATNNPTTWARYSGHKGYLCAEGGEQRPPNPTESVWVGSDGRRSCADHHGMTPPAAPASAPAPTPDTTALRNLSPAPPGGATQLAEIPESFLQERYGTTRAEVEAIKVALAPPGTTDFEMLLYLGVSKRLGLDPFVPGLVHFVRFPASKYRGERTGIVLGYLGYIQMAQEQKDCDGFSVESFPPAPAENPTHATATVWKKGWAHPLTTTVTMKEKRKTTPFWTDSPRQALETAALRRAVRMAWPSLFAAYEDAADDDEEEGEDPVRRAVNGKVGTVMGEHHGERRPEPPAPKPLDAEFRTVDPPPPETPSAPADAGAPPASEPEVIEPGPTQEVDPARAATINEAQTLMLGASPRVKAAREDVMRVWCSTWGVDSVAEALTKKTIPLPVIDQLVSRLKAAGE